MNALGFVVSESNNNCKKMVYIIYIIKVTNHIQHKT